MRLLPLVLILGALPAAAQDCGTPAACYRQGFTDGVAAVNAQLGAVTAQMQRDVQAQVNAQLAELDARRIRDLEARLAEAQDAALARQGPVGVTGMPTLPPLARAPGGGIAPVLPSDEARGTAIETRPDPRIPADPAALPAGATITITDPQNLPPDLFRALMDHAAR